MICFALGEKQNVQFFKGEGHSKKLLFLCFRLKQVNISFSTHRSFSPHRLIEVSATLKKNRLERSDFGGHHLEVSWQPIHVYVTSFRWT